MGEFLNNVYEKALVSVKQVPGLLFFTKDPPHRIKKLHNETVSSMYVFLGHL